MFGETPIFHVMICSHPTETTTLKWKFWVTGEIQSYLEFLNPLEADPKGYVLGISPHVYTVTGKTKGASKTKKTCTN